MGCGNPIDYFTEKVWVAVTAQLLGSPTVGQGQLNCSVPLRFRGRTGPFWLSGPGGGSTPFDLVKKTCKQKNNGGQPVERMVASKLLLFVFDVDHSGNEVVKGSKTQL